MTTLSQVLLWLTVALWLAAVLLDLRRRRLDQQRRRARERECLERERERVNRLYDNLRAAIGSRLHAEAARMGLPVRIVEPSSDNSDWAGRLVIKNGRSVVVELRRDLAHYLTLAHELGHHIAITRRGDYSERAADEEGMRLVFSVLSDEEAELFRPIAEALEKARERSGE